MKKLVQKFLKPFKYGEKGFTLIELLVVISILGILAAVAIPNVAKLMGAGTTQAKAAELANARTAVQAAMAFAQTDVCGTGTLSKTSDITVTAKGSGITCSVGDFLQGTHLSLAYSYTVSADGGVVSP